MVPERRPMMRRRSIAIGVCTRLFAGMRKPGEAVSPDGGRGGRSAPELRRVYER